MSSTQQYTHAYTYTDFDKETCINIYAHISLRMNIIRKILNVQKMLDTMHARATIYT